MLLAGSLRILAIVSYLASLPFPPYLTRVKGMEVTGFQILLCGPIFIFDSVASAWLANPLAISSLCLMKARPRLCVVLSAAALFAARGFTRLDSVGWDSGRDIHGGRVVGLGIASILWLAALALTWAASFTFALHRILVPERHDDGRLVFERVMVTAVASALAVAFIQSLHVEVSRFCEGQDVVCDFAAACSAGLREQLTFSKQCA
jgi:hypothetical protein